MSEVDTLRWGDTQTLSFVPNAGATALIGVSATKQLAAAHWSRPLTWRLLVSVVPGIPVTIPAETATFNATLLLTLGVGAGLITIPIAIPVGPTAGVYLPVTQFFTVPAQDIQAQMSVDVSNAANVEIDHAFQMTFLAAPFTEPAGYTDLRDAVMSALGKPLQPGFREHDQDQMPRWMGPGFLPGETRYR